MYFFIEQALIETIRKYCDRYHLLDLLTKVNECMADKQRQNGVKAVHVPYLNHTLRAEMHLGKHESHGWTIKTCQHSRPQRPRSFWSAPRIATSENVQFLEHAQRMHFVFAANDIVRLDSEHAQSDGKSINRGLPVLNLPRSRFLVLTKRSAGTRMTPRQHTKGQ